MLEVVELVLRQQRLDLRQILLRDIGQHQVLVRRQTERALVHLRDLAQAGLELAPGHVLDAAVLDVHHEVVLAVLALRPAEVVDVAVEGERSGGRELPAEQLLDLFAEAVDTEAVDGVLEARVLAAVVRLATAK